MSDSIAYRASIVHCLDDPGPAGDESAVEHFDDGLLVVEKGHIAALGPADDLLAGSHAGIETVDLTGKLILPGLIDCHVHFSQVDIIASYGEQLLDWLNRYAYPAEELFVDPVHAADVAEFFADELLRNGTTTAQVFATVHPQSVDAIFSVAERKNMRLIAGKVMMDRLCPETLRDDVISSIADSRQLIEKWHKQSRLGYAITPRFAITSTDEQLAAAGRLAAEYPDTHVQTHLAENHEEVELIQKQFPWSRSYLDVYEHFGLVRERSLFAHCLHLDEQDWDLLADRGATAAFCPTSNLFLGSGLFDLDTASSHGVSVGIASDVGGGTSLNLLRTLNEAYKVLHLQGQALPAYRALYLATRGAAKALCLEDRIGSFERGAEADFVVVDGSAASMTARRLGNSQDIAEKLFALIMLGDDRNVSATYLMGREAYSVAG
jgi:guanine deaminase